METGTMDQVEETIPDENGTVREIDGIPGDNAPLEAEGVGEKIPGIIQGTLDQFKKILGKN